jgi:hypothetical protein
MRLSLAALLLIGATSAPAFADHRHGSIRYEENCYRNVERYIPGYYDDFGNWRDGRVKTTRKRIPCSSLYNSQRERHTHDSHAPDVGRVDDNSCIEGSVLGGIAGGGLGAALSRGNGRWWAIPLGIVGGSMVGCQVDGG